jgi:hypothetical protein
VWAVVVPPGHTEGENDMTMLKWRATPLAGVLFIVLVGCGRQEPPPPGKPSGDAYVVSVPGMH